MSPHICLVWLVLRYEPCPWSSRVNTCWEGIAFNSSSSQLSRSKMFSTPWKCTHCLRAMPGSLVESCPNRLVRECSHGTETLIFYQGISWNLLVMVSGCLCNQEINFSKIWVAQNSVAQRIPGKCWINIT